MREWSALPKSPKSRSRRST